MNQMGIVSPFCIIYFVSTYSSQHMKDAILEGGHQFEKAHGISIFQYMNMDPAFNKIFNKGMADLIMKKILEVYQGFEGLTSLVDVGGGTGKCLSMIIPKYPSIKGINFDLPHVTQSAPSSPGNIPNFFSNINLLKKINPIILLENTKNVYIYIYTMM